MKTPKHKKKHVAVVGLGYVGWPLALLAKKKGYDVTGIDISADKLSERADEAKKKRIALSQTFQPIASSDIIVVCVPTPVHENHEPDLDPLRAASTGIAPHLKRGALVLIESTVNPGVCEEIILPLLSEGSGLEPTDIYFAHCPERINPGDQKWNVENIPRVVGAFNEKSLNQAVRFYRSILTGEVMPLASLKEAEAVKMVENSFRDINIAFVNELAMSFSVLDIDVMHVIKGASTKPFSFMPHYPGCGVGGHCIPVDPYYLITYAKQNGFTHRFLAMARDVNNKMPAFTVKRLLEVFTEKGIKPEDARVAVLGIAYKPNIEDHRESPALVIQDLLKKEGMEIIAYDPYVPELSSAKNLKEALSGVTAAVIATAHDDFVKLQPSLLKKAGVSIVIDGRNCLSKERFVDADITYRGIGR